MKLLHIAKDEGLRLAILTEHGVLDLVEASEAFALPVPQTLKQAIVQGEEGVVLSYPESEQSWLASEDEITISIQMLGTLRNTLS